MISPISYLTNFILIMPIIVAIYKIITIVIFKIKKKNMKISSYGFTVSVILLIFYYVFIREINALFYVSIISLGLGLLIYNSVRTVKEDMFVIPIFIYSIFCLVLGNITENRIFFMLLIIVLIPDIIKIFKECFMKG